MRGCVVEREGLVAAALATAIATITATTVAAATRSAGLHRTGDVDGQVTATEVLAVEAIDGGFSFLSRTHFYKAEAFGAAGFALHHHFGGLNRTKAREFLVKIVVANRVSEVADVEFVAHR